MSFNSFRAFMAATSGTFLVSLSLSLSMKVKARPRRVVLPRQASSSPGGLVRKTSICVQALN